MSGYLNQEFDFYALMYETDTYGINNDDVYLLMGNPNLVPRVNKGKSARLNDGESFLAGWQPMYVFELEAAYLTSELKDESYKLLDKEMSIKDAVAFAEDFFMNKLPYETNPDIGIDIPEVHVYEVKDGVFGYCFLLRRKYNGIPFEYIMSGRARSEMSDKKQYESDMRESFMIESDDIDFWVGDEKCQNIEHIGEPIKKILGLEAVIDIVSNKLSAGVMFNIDSVELVYSRVNEDGSGTRKLFKKELEKHSAEIQVKWTSHSFDSIIAALLQNLGVSVLSHRIVQPYVNRGELCEINITDMALTRHFSLVHHKNKHLTDPMKALIQQFTNTKL